MMISCVALPPVPLRDDGRARASHGQVFSPSKAAPSSGRSLSWSPT